MTLPDVFLALDQAIAEAAPEELPRLIGDLEAAKAAALMRLGAQTAEMLRAAMARAEAMLRAPDSNLAEDRAPRYLGTDEALARLGGKLCRRTLYRRTKGRSFRLNLSRKVVRFEERGLLRWIENGCR